MNKKYRYKVVDRKDNDFGIKDEADGIVEYFRKAQIKEFLNKGIEIFGATIKDGEVEISRSGIFNREGFKARYAFLGKEVVFINDYRTQDENRAFIKMRSGKDILVINDSFCDSFRHMFYFCGAKSIDLSLCDTSAITDMSYCFYNCRATELVLDNLDTSNVTDMKYMFNASRAEYLDVSGLDTSKVTDMECMFQSSYADEIKFGGKFDTSNVGMMRGMFQGLVIESLDISSFDTTNVTNIDNMFSMAEINKLILGKFELPNIGMVHELFHDFRGQISTDNPDVRRVFKQAVTGAKYLDSYMKGRRKNP